MKKNKVVEINTKKERAMLSVAEKHPFVHMVRRNNVRQVAGEYLAMSEAFPYLQAGSQKELIFDKMAKNQPVDKAIEVTSVVGNFLTWDETGGHYLVQEYGNDGLTKMLDTNKYFHANLLRKDWMKLFGEDVPPNYSETTKRYLEDLYDGLSSIDEVERCAAMIAFESHAELMITSLWNSLSNIFPDIPQNDLFYFYVHVGGDDPAEEYHVMMTNQMLEELVPEEQIDLFMMYFTKYYQSNIEWCRAICLN